MAGGSVRAVGVTGGRWECQGGGGDRRQRKCQGGGGDKWECQGVHMYIDGMYIRMDTVVIPAHKHFP